MPVGANTDIRNRMIGIAAADLPHNGRELYVYPSQQLPFFQGELKAIEASNDVNTTNDTGSYSGSLKTTNFLKCYWRGDSENPYPPAIRKGEQVTIFSLGDSDMWYWSCEGRDESMRRLDTKRLSVSGNLDNNSESTDDNSYFLEIDTLRNKHIKLSTSQQDGEKYRYMLLMDAGNNTISLTDDKNNSVTIESSDTPRITLRNSKNSFIKLEDESISIACKKDITVKSEQGKIMFQSKDNISMTSTNGRATVHGKQRVRLTSESDDVHIGAKEKSIIFECKGPLVLAGARIAMVRYTGSLIDWGNDYV